MFKNTQHLADPSRPSGSYRRQGSDCSSDFSEESLSPSYRGGGSGSSFGTACSTTGSAVSGLSSSGYSVASAFTPGARRDHGRDRGARNYTFNRRHSSGGSSLSMESEAEGGDSIDAGERKEEADLCETEVRASPAGASTLGAEPSAVLIPTLERNPSTEYSRLFSPKERGSSGGGGKRRMQMS